MENKNIIIILVVIIVILAAAIGVLFLNPTAAKEPCKIKITSDKSQYEGDEKLSIQLTDFNKTPISKEIVNITITNSKGKMVVDDVVKTNDKGKAKLDLDLKKGKYTVNVTYGGNENYTGNSTTQKLTIKEEVVEATPQQSTQSSIHYDAEINLYYDDNGVIVDPDGQHPQGVGESYSKYREARDRWERGEDVMV